MSKLYIFTDGACSFNNTVDIPGIGGWAFVAVQNISDTKHYSRASGRVENTTNNQMELKAVERALNFSIVTETTNIEIHCDSKYVIDGCVKHLHVWISKGWKKSDKKPVLNQGLWAEINHLLEVRETKGYTTTFIKVDGHSGNCWNDNVDKLAVARTQELPSLIAISDEIKLSLSESDLEELSYGKDFHWVFGGVKIHLFKGTSDENKE